MSFTERGVIEGFYDRLWTWGERTRVATEVAAMGFTTYVYAPKEDRLQNAGWRTPYPDDERRHLRAFAAHCRSVGLRTWFGLRPVGISYADGADAERVVAKLHDDVALGADGILLLADDIPESLDPATAGRFATLAEAHLWLIDQVLPEVEVPVAFCPTAYHGPGGPYLERLGADMPAGVALCWTGPQVCSPAISAADAAAIGEVLRRPPLLWDNYPVNDAAMTGELHIGPIRDRDPRLADLAAGIWVNPAMEPEASLVPLATWAEYLADPPGYDPDAAWRRALGRFAGSDADAEAVAALAAVADRSVIDQPWRTDTGRADPAARRAASVANSRLAADLRRFVDALPSDG